MVVQKPENVLRVWPPPLSRPDDMLTTMCSALKVSHRRSLLSPLPLVAVSDTPL
jgi:hypothetical protein